MPPIIGRMIAALRVIHLGPSVAVTVLSAALAAILLNQAGAPLDQRWLLTVLSVAGSQVFIGATNDIVDRLRDQVAGRTEKPLVRGQLTPGGAAWIASIGLAVMLTAASRVDSLTLGLSVSAAASATIYNLFLSRTPLSPIPYLVSLDSCRCGSRPASRSRSTGLRERSRLPRYSPERRTLPTRCATSTAIERPGHGALPSSWAGWRPSALP